MSQTPTTMPGEQGGPEGMPTADTATAPAEQGLLSRWAEVMRTTNPPTGRLDPVSRWLVLTRAAVLPMTLTAGLVAGLLAVRKPGFSTGWYLLALAGILLAHVSNNLMNDLFDAEVGTDTNEYPRALYAPHPILSGLITRRGLATAAFVVNLADLAILIVLTWARGWPIIGFGVGGFLLSAAYTAPPLRLKKRGLGEPDVLIVWGPLMVGGTYFAAVGSIPWEVVLASIPYGLLCTAVLMGKHIDKIPWDGPDGTRTLPVLLGEARARRVTRGLMAGFYVLLVVCVAVRALPWPALAALAGLPVLVRVWKAFGEPKPDAPPPRFPVWPLWFAAVAFLHTRRAGAFLVLGLALAAGLGIRISG
ncbi:MAG TPA: prenyltransferase [Acidimicrobiales bacterium]|nr:prenyltransferase [Acidimicrobiales bacterium]